MNWINDFSVNDLGTCKKEKNKKKRKKGKESLNVLIRLRMIVKRSN